MARVAIDSNLLIYAELEPDTAKGRQAADVILRAAPDGVVPVQVLGEFLRFVQRRAPAALDRATRQVELIRDVFLTPPTTDKTIASAIELASRHRLQFWDSVVCVAALDAGARFLLTEDMQDGRSLDGLRLLNPFATDNAREIAAALGND